MGIVNECLHFSKSTGSLHFQKSADCLHFQSQLIIYILKSADFFHFKSQLITKSYVSLEGISNSSFSRFWILSRFCLNGEGRRKEEEFLSLEVRAKAQRT